MRDTSESTEDEYQTPSLTVYGSAEAITAEGNSAFSDQPRGPNDPPSYYS
jgi:hypothetical protein